MQGASCRLLARSAAQTTGGLAGHGKAVCPAAENYRQAMAFSRKICYNECYASKGLHKVRTLRQGAKGELL